MQIYIDLIIWDAHAQIFRHLRPRTGDARHAELRVLGSVGRALGRLGRPRHPVLLVQPPGAASALRAGGRGGGGSARSTCEIHGAPL